MTESERFPDTPPTPIVAHNLGNFTPMFAGRATYVCRPLQLHLCQIAETLREKGVDLVVLDQNIDTSDATGRLLFNMLGAIGQFETEIRAERQMDGIKKAKDRGVQFGKRPALNDDQIEELREKREQGALIKDLMAHYSLSKATIYRYLGTNET